MAGEAEAHLLPEIWPRCHGTESRDRVPKPKDGGFGVGGLIDVGDTGIREIHVWSMEGRFLT